MNSTQPKEHIKNGERTRIKIIIYQVMTPFLPVTIIVQLKGMPSFLKM